MAGPGFPMETRLKCHFSPNSIGEYQLYPGGPYPCSALHLLCSAMLSSHLLASEICLGFTESLYILAPEHCMDSVLLPEQDRTRQVGQRKNRVPFATIVVERQPSTGYSKKSPSISWCEDPFPEFHAPSEELLLLLLSRKVSNNVIISGRVWGS